MTAGPRQVYSFRRSVAVLVTVFGVVAGGSAARAQQTGPTVNQCSSGVVDSTNGVEQTVCLYGDISGLNGYAETDNNVFGTYYTYADEVGSDGAIWNTSEALEDFGDQCCGSGETSSGTITPQVNVWYTLSSSYDEDVCDPFGDCNWSYGNTGLETSAEITPGVPPAPTGLMATAGDGVVTVSWTGASGATSYNIYEGTSSGGESSTPIATGISGTTYNVAGLSNGTAYYFTVAAVNSYGTSGYSNEATATPEAPPTTPVVMTVTPSSGYVGLAVTISGSKFGAAEGQSTVTFNGVAAGVLSWSDSSITAVVPSNATTGPVVVTLGDGAQSNNNVIFTVGTSSCN